MCEVKDYATSVTQLIDVLMLHVPKGMIKLSFASLGKEKGKELLETADRLGIRAEFLNTIKSFKPKNYQSS